MSKKNATISVIIVAGLHVIFMILELTMWNTELGRKLTHLSFIAAQETVNIGINPALYNGFLGFLLFWATFALRERESYSLQRVVLMFIIFMGIIGAIWVRNPGIFLLQCLPAVVALILVTLSRPIAMKEVEAA